MYKLNSITKTSGNNDYNVINCKTEQIVGHLKQSIHGHWFYTNRELNIIDKVLNTLSSAILEITKNDHQLRYQGISPEGNGMNKSGSLEEIEELARRNFNRYGMVARVFRSDGTEIMNFLTGLEAETHLQPAR